MSLFPLATCFSFQASSPLLVRVRVFVLIGDVDFAQWFSITTVRLVDSVVQMVLGWLRISSSRTGIIVDTISTCLGIVAHYSWLPIMVAYTTGIV